MQNQKIPHPQNIQINYNLACEVCDILINLPRTDLTMQFIKIVNNKRRLVSDMKAQGIIEN